jgi:hypothetical protein
MERFNAGMNSSEDETMRKALGQWKIAAPLPPRFKEGVWRRIEQAASAPTAWELWQRWLEGVFARKAVALAYVAVLLLAGLTAGYVNGRAYEQRANARLATQYVQSLDPYQKNP